MKNSREKTSMHTDVLVFRVEDFRDFINISQELEMSRRKGFFVEILGRGLNYCY